MNWRFFKQVFTLVTLISLWVINEGSAQTTSYEFWPEVDIWYNLSPSWRLSSFIPVTKYNESKYRDLNIYLQTDYRWGKTRHTFLRRQVDDNKEGQIKGWMARGGFMEGWSLGENAGAYTEDMLYAEIHKRLILNGGMLLSHRIRTDFRWIGQDPQYSYRIRYRLMIEKELAFGHSSVVPYINAEPYWDSRYTGLARVRVSAGAAASWGPRFSFESNITYQYDTHYDTPNMYALNLILHVFFEKKKKSDNTGT